MRIQLSPGSAYGLHLGLDTTTALRASAVAFLSTVLREGPEGSQAVGFLSPNAYSGFLMVVLLTSFSSPWWVCEVGLAAPRSKGISEA